MIAQRKAEGVWEGDLMKGKGTLNAGSGAFTGFPVTWASRTEGIDRATSPEELLAAAHASCYSMALASTLAKDATAPSWLAVTAVCTLDRVQGTLKVTTMELSVSGKVDGIDQAKFQDAAEAAEKTCPISNSIRNNIKIRLNAKLD